MALQTKRELTDKLTQSAKNMQAIRDRKDKERVGDINNEPVTPSSRAINLERR